MKIKAIDDVANLHGKRVFLTCDFNISLKDGKIANDTRIREALPTIKYLLQRKNKIIIASHLGRPQGHDMAYSLKPVAEKLENLTGKKIELLDNFWEKDILARINSINSDKIILLENIRFYKGEKRKADYE